jgi:hypothetical protein
METIKLLSLKKKKNLQFDDNQKLESFVLHF